MIDRTTGKITLLGFSSASAARTQLSAAPVDALAYNGMQVNGAMEVAQENGTSSVTLTATGTLQFKYLLDGVMAGFRGTFVAAGQQVAAPSGMPAAKALKITVTTAQASLGANDELSVLLPVEGTRTSRLLSGTSLASAQSLGFWFSAHRTGTYSGAIMNGAKTRSCPFSFTVSAADTPQWVSLSGAAAIPADTSGTWANDTTVGMLVSICLAGGSSRLGTPGAWAATTSPGLSGATGSSNGVGATSDVFYISNVIALPGIELPPSDRVPLVMRAFDQELGLCQRYFRSSWDYGTAPGTTWTAGFDQMKFSHPIGDFSTTQIFPAMRIAGTLTIYDAAANINKVTYFDNISGGWTNNGTLTTTLAKQGAMFVQHVIANSRFTNFGFRIDARL